MAAKLSNPAVGKLLRDGKIQKSVKYATAIRGWHTYSQGYVLEPHAQGASPEFVIVSWQINHDDVDHRARRQGIDKHVFRMQVRREGLAECKRVLSQHYTVEDFEALGEPMLRLTVRKTVEAAA